jgi:hypothetical protein
MKAGMTLAIVILCLASSVAFAAGKRGGGGGGGSQTPCAPDARRLCGDVLTNRPARMACMRAHESELSATCRSWRASLGGRGGAGAGGGTPYRMARRACLREYQLGNGRHLKWIRQVTLDQCVTQKMGAQ